MIFFFTASGLRPIGPAPRWDEAVKPQFRFSGKMVEEATTDGFLCVLCELCEKIIF